MARLASTVLVVALLAATATAFALTEGLKLEPSPILGTDVAKVFSPVCECESAEARISFRLRRADRLDIALVDSDGNTVVTPIRGRRYPRGRVVVRWDGVGADGQLLPEGEYRPRVHLRQARRTIVLPNPIEIDVTPPAIESVRLSRRVFSPDGDGRSDRVLVRYELGEEGRGLLFVNGRRRGLTRFPRTEDRVTWNGRQNSEGLPAGVYRIQLSARDPAGNLAVRTKPTTVVIRYVALGRSRVVTTAAARFAIRVSSDARRVRWTLGARSGSARPGTLRLRAPRQKGRYTLLVSANGHTARAAVFVREPSR